MKKFLAILLVLTMVIGTGIMVSAQGNLTDVTSITFVKSLDAQGRNPAETFDFTVSGGQVKEGSANLAPAFTPSTFSITVGEGAGSGSTNVNLPGFEQPGKYEYTITETSKNTAGMGYDTTARTLVVLVVRGGDGELIRIAGMKGEDGKKSSDFTVANNTFNSGNLTVAKVIAGNLADPGDIFEIKVHLRLPEGSEKDLDLSAMSHNNSLIDNGDGTFTLTYTVSGGDDFTIGNIPYGVEYEVVETDNHNYDITYNGNAETMDAAEKSATVTNTRNTDIDTGISLDNLPYIMTMALALGGLVLFVVRKRRLN